MFLNVFSMFAVEDHLALLLMSSKKQPRIISLEKPLASSVPEAADMLPGSVLYAL